jgi:site-specific DNA-methyltransferase (adenine-specific)
MSEIQIATADAINFLSDLPPESVHLLVADPPYNIGLHYGAGVDDNLPAHHYQHFVRQVMMTAAPAMHPKGSMWWIINDENAAQAVAIAKSLFFHLRNWVIWHETFGVNCTHKFSRCKRHLLYFVRDPVYYTFNADAIRIPSDRQLKYKDKRANPAGKVPGDVWEIPRVCGTFKERIIDVPTQLPEELVERVVRACSNPGDMVCDPFVGSGTTPAVCAHLDRHFTGCDINPKYVQIAQERVTNGRSQNCLVGK